MKNARITKKDRRVASAAEHQQQHILWHHTLDRIVADWIFHTKTPPSQATVMDLLKWSWEETINPTEVKIK